MAPPRRVRSTRRPRSTPGLERLEVESRPDLPRRFTPRERRVEAISAALFLGCALALALSHGSVRDLDVVTLVGLIAFHAVSSHIRLFAGAGCAMPTQVALILMLFLLPVALVPFAVAAGLLVAEGIDVARRGAHSERLLSAIGDSWHALPGVLVFAAAAEPRPEVAAVGILAVALAAQFAGDLFVSTLREWAGRGILPTLQLRAMATVYGVDLALAPLGLLAAAQAVDARGAWLFAVAPVLLLGGLAGERRRRIQEAAENAEDLRHERLRLQEVLRGAGRAFAANLNREALLLAVAETAAEALDAEVGWVGTDLEDAKAEAFATGGDAGVTKALERVLARTDQSVGVAVVREGEWHAIACAMHGRNVNPERVVVARRGTPFEIEDVTLLGYLASQAAISMENTDLHERTRVQATVDELTGLSNHRRLQERLDAEITAAQPLALILVDIDDFKAVNDTLGHQQGDLVLKSVGKVVRNCFRDADELARYGGEELAVVIPGATLESAAEAAERLRAKVERMRVPVPSGPPIRVTLSAGVAAFTAAGSYDKQGLVAAADQALYVAKRGGKNRVAMAKEAVAAAVG